MGGVTKPPPGPAGQPETRHADNDTDPDGPAGRGPPQADPGPATPAAVLGPAPADPRRGRLVTTRAPPSWGFDS